MTLLRHAAVILLAVCAPLSSIGVAQTSEMSGAEKIASHVDFQIGDRYFGGPFIFVFDRKVIFKGKVRYKRGIALDANADLITDANAAQNALRNISARSGCAMESHQFVPGSSLTFSLRCDP